MAPRTYFAKNIHSVKELTKVIQGKRLWKRMIIETLRKIRCKLRVHFLVRQKWVNKDNHEDFEWHIGCIYCPKFQTMPSSAKTVQGALV